ncbi:kinesin-like protein KIFC2 isoform X8 [Mustela lutreola]|uniref:kinesin-like protein KIFC2 isoform X8 n=1 Tax=Mustela lutreola TaxID=9666 RepID=UPI00279777D9|nr:kinesin-like protein KIFC2 isoform X8 [Mustela lutreola]
MYAFYSLLIYIFYSLFRRDGGAAAAGDPEDPAQSAGCKRGGRRRPDQPTAELWTELTGLVGLPGCSESEDGREEGAEGRATEVSLEEALVRLAEFLSVQLGAEESSGSPPDLTKPSDVPPLLTVTGQLLALLAWTRSPRRRQALSQGTQPALEGQCPTPVGSPSREESPSLSPRDEAQGQNPPQLEEDRRAWQRLEQLILGQLEELKQQLELQEEELGRLRLGVGFSLRQGATDSEKRVQHLTLENEALKQSLSLMRDLLLHWGPAASTRAPQEEAEALVELQGRLQEAQDTTEALQVQVFRELEPAVLSCLRGYSVCIFTYGQTGTGKTYSMEGPPEDPGIAPRALQSLFQEMGTGGQHRVTLSMVEIYNEAVRDLLAPGPPERLAVRQGPAGQGGIQVAGLTYWDVPNLETLHQGCRPCSGQVLSLRPPDAEPGEEQQGHRRHLQEPAQLSVACLGHTDLARGVPTARARHRRHPASGGPGGIRACLEGGGSRPVAGRRRRRPASAGGPDHQSLAAGLGGRDGRAAGPPATRALPRLAAHATAAAGAGTRRHGGAAAADLHAARGPGGDSMLAEVRRARGPSRAGARPALQGPALRDALLPQHRHAPHRDPLHAHAAPRQPPESRRGERLRLGSRDPKERVLLAWTRALPTELLHPHNLLDLRDPLSSQVGSLAPGVRRT